jgi:bifunctional non-homologous end joining protein LigD
LRNPDFARSVVELSVAVNKTKSEWFRPLVQAAIEYGSITDDGLLREAVFKGLRDDLPVA